MPGTVLRVSRILTIWSLPATLWDKHCCYSHCSDEEIHTKILKWHSPYTQLVSHRAGLWTQTVWLQSSVLCCLSGNGSKNWSFSRMISFQMYIKLLYGNTLCLFCMRHQSRSNINGWEDTLSGSFWLSCLKNFEIVQPGIGLLLQIDIFPFLCL